MKASIGEVYMKLTFLALTGLVCAGVLGTMACSSDSAPAETPTAEDGDVPDAGPGDDDATPGTADSGDEYGATALPIDCRRPENRPHDSMNPDPRCHGYDDGPGLGTGPKVQDYDTAFYDKASDTFFVSTPSLVLAVEAKTGNRKILSGIYEDPATGTQTIGTGPIWSSGNLFAIRPKKDGKIWAFGDSGFYVIDPASGTRTLQRDLAGIPPENTIRLEGYFAVDDNEDFYVVLTRGTSGGGVGVLKFKTGGVGEVVTLSGASDTSRNKGTGIDYDVAGYAALQLYKGKVWILNGDANNLMSVDPATGNRVVVSGAGVGTDVDGNVHGIAGEGGGQNLFIDETHDVAYANGTKIDLKTGDRSYGSPHFRDVIEAADPLNAIGDFGWIFYQSGDLFYDLTAGEIRVTEPATGNYNSITRE